MRISDWSSDVCSSDLARDVDQHAVVLAGLAAHATCCDNQREAFDRSFERWRYAVAAVVERDMISLVHRRPPALRPAPGRARDRQSVVYGQRGAVRVGLGGRRLIKKTTTPHKTQ